ncbi:MAG: hypothetical protein IKN41_04790 [Candidatus Methanomethylophilaceae archaeon]|nr:hypothetical protein [Candidatus Methanomethylophilaceae archaeon]
MTGNLDRNVVYTYRIQTNFSEVAQQAQEEIGGTQDEVQELNRSMQELQSTSDATNTHLKQTKQEIQGTILTLTAMASAVNRVTNGLIQLGMISDADAESIKNINAAFQVMIGLATGLKSLALVQEMLNLQALKGAIINTYNSVLESPWKLALVSAGAGAAAGVAMAYGANSGSVTENTVNNIIIRDVSGAQSNAANSINATINGGKVL